jgi:hypothetical protein
MESTPTSFPGASSCTPRRALATRYPRSVKVQAVVEGPSNLLTATGRMRARGLETPSAPTRAALAPAPLPSGLRRRSRRRTRSTVTPSNTNWPICAVLKTERPRCTRPGPCRVPSAPRVAPSQHLPQTSGLNTPHPFPPPARPLPTWVLLFFFSFSFVLLLVLLLTSHPCSSFLSSPVFHFYPSLFWFSFFTPMPSPFFLSSTPSLTPLSLVVEREGSGRGWMFAIDSRGGHWASQFFGLSTLKWPAR